jgi:hypothetical protein
MTGDNYRDYYDLEDYLFGKVTARFQKDRRLDAFDFFCIVIWKANRAKSKIAKLLFQHGLDDLESAIGEVTSQLAAEADTKARLKILISDWKFHLPMASAILTVLYPSEYTIYDVRVCNVLGDFHKVQDRNFDD